MKEKINVIALAAGGSGGHVFPAKALAMEMMSRGWKTALITDHRGGEIELGDNLQIYRVRAGGLAGKKISGLLRSIPNLIIGTLQARRILKTLSPSVVMGFGGYASVPTMIAAIRGQYPTGIHEQNAVLGRANRFLAQKVDRIAITHSMCNLLPSEAEAKIIHTGMPVRPEILNARNGKVINIDDTEFINLLVIGGSQGARIFGEVVPKAIAQLPQEILSRLHIVQQCRREDLMSVRSSYGALGVRVTLGEFFEDMPRLLQMASLIITRSGASSVAEILAVGRPSIMVPYPFAVDQHQLANAHAVSESGAGWLIDQSMFTPENLSSRLKELFNNGGTLLRVADCAKRASFDDAIIRLANFVEELCDKREIIENKVRGV